MTNINIDEYLQRGFGSMNKTELEVMIFHQLLQMKDYHGLNDYALSIKLRIPQTKVTKLRYESALRYNNLEQNVLKDAARDLLQHVHVRKDGQQEKIVFATEDKILRNYINSILTAANRPTDSSFNRDIISMHTEDFAYLLKQLYTGNELNEVEKEIRKKYPNKKISWEDVVKIILQAALGQVGTQAVDLTIRGISNLINKI